MIGTCATQGFSNGCRNRDGEAVQAKLDALIIALRRVDNRLVGAEDLPGHELHKLRKMIAGQVERDEDTSEEIEGRSGGETG